MDFENLLQEIQNLIEQGDWSALRDLLSDTPEPEIVDLLFELDKFRRALVFRLLPRTLAAEVFAFLEPPQQDSLLTDLTDEETRQILANMKPDDRTHFLEELPGQATQRLMNLLSPEDLREARQLLGYPEDSTGRLMTPDYVAVRPQWPTNEALEHIRRKGRETETINVIYAVDRNWRLLGSIDLRSLLLADPESMTEDVMETNIPTITACEDREEAVRIIQRYNLDVLPVIDSDGVLLGIVTIDDVLDVSQEEATEDFHMTAAVTPLEGGYSSSGVAQLYYKRIVWLAALVVTNLLSSSIIAAYGNVLSRTLALTFFIPLLTGTGGNTGSQSATLMVRALATGDLDVGQWALVFSKELAVGAAIGSTLGVVGGMLGFLHGDYTIALIVGVTMMAIVIWSNLVGVFLPIFLTKLRLDPAMASSPLISTLSDASGLLIYFTIAARVLGA